MMNTSSQKFQMLQTTPIMVIANDIPVAVDGVDNNPANVKPKNYQQEMENGEDDDDSTDNEKEN